MTNAPDWKDRIAAVLKVNGNDKCADCGQLNPDWGVYNIGIFVCIECSGIHREMGVDIAKVKSTRLDAWTEAQLQAVEGKGNIMMNRIYEGKLPRYHLTPGDCHLPYYRKWFIKQKYEHRQWYLAGDDQKTDAKEQTETSPGRLATAVFVQESSRKKVIFQILGEFLHFFRSPVESFSFEKYNVKNLKTTVIQGEAEKDALLWIQSTNESLFRVRDPGGETQNLVEFAHQLRKATDFYRTSEADVGRPLAPPRGHLEKMTAKQVEQGTILGFASKKGGGVRGFKKRWWVVYDGFAYYFRGDFRTDKKSPEEGEPQGFICLHGADIAIDETGRTGKRGCVLLATQDRTFFIVPAEENKGQFIKTLEDECLKLWPRVELNLCSKS